MTEVHPRTAIRRFDVFAEYQRQEALADGIPADEAAGYGLWVAKVVASRSYGRALFKGTPTQVREQAAQQETAAAGAARPKWHTLEGQPQTDALFEEQIVRRMGQEFYQTVFVPAIEAARQAGKSYQGIRDSIRRPWTPAPPSQSGSGAGDAGGNS
jgi:hypothetical protein